MFTKPVMWCRRCGLYSSELGRNTGLEAPCSGPKSSSHWRLQNLLRGCHPTSAADLHARTLEWGSPRGTAGQAERPQRAKRQQAGPRPDEDDQAAATASSQATDLAEGQRLAHEKLAALSRLLTGDEETYLEEEAPPAPRRRGPAALPARRARGQGPLLA